MVISDRQLLDTLSRMPFIDSVELALILGEPHSTVHRILTGLLADGIVGRASHGTAHLPSSRRYHLTANGMGEAALVLGFGTPSDFVRAYPVSSEWLALLIRRMDAVAAIYRLAASLSPGIDSLRSHVEFHRRGRFDATITLHDGRSFGNRLSRLLREAMELRQAYHRGEAADFAAEAERLRREATYHLRDRPMSDADNWRLQNELGWHHDRGNLLRFLDDPSIEPTNNRAERALRGAVIARKVSHCSKNVGGCGCVLGLHQRNQDPGSQWRRSLAGQRALLCVQRCSGPHPFLLNPSSHSAPLINYVSPFLVPGKGSGRVHQEPDNVWPQTSAQKRVSSTGRGV